MTGQEKKIKISELPASVTFTGLWTLGYQFVDGKKTSVRVSLDEIGQAYTATVTATQAANAAAGLANTAAEKANAATAAALQAAQTAEGTNHAVSNQEAARIEAEQARVTAETKRAASESVRKEAEDARIAEEALRKQAEKDREEHEATRQRQEAAREEGTAEAILGAEQAIDRLHALSDHRDEIRDGYWWRWNEETKEYENTGETANGNTLFATFEVDLTTGELSVTTPDGYAGPAFELSDEGEISVVINEKQA